MTEDAKKTEDPNAKKLPSWAMALLCLIVGAIVALALKGLYGEDDPAPPTVPPAPPAETGTVATDK